MNMVSIADSRMVRIHDWSAYVAELLECSLEIMDRRHSE